MYYIAISQTLITKVLLRWIDLTSFILHN